MRTRTSQSGSKPLCCVLPLLMRLDWGMFFIEYVASAVTLPQNLPSVSLLVALTHAMFIVDCAGRPVRVLWAVRRNP